MALNGDSGQCGAAFIEDGCGWANEHFRAVAVLDHDDAMLLVNDGA